MNKIQFKLFISIICTLLVFSVNTIAADYYLGAEGGFALHDDMDDVRQGLANASGQTISSPNGAGGARGFLGYNITEELAVELGGFWFSDVNFVGSGNLRVDLGAYGGDASFVVKPKVMQGLFLKAGGSYSQSTVNVRQGVANVSIAENGAGYLVGAGYESSILSDDTMVRIAYSRYGSLGGGSDFNSNFFSIGLFLSF